MGVSFLSDCVADAGEELNPIPGSFPAKDVDKLTVDALHATTAV
jgi:hypothetical protein